MHLVHIAVVSVVKLLFLGCFDVVREGFLEGKSILATCLVHRGNALAAKVVLANRAD